MFYALDTTLDIENRNHNQDGRIQRGWEDEGEGEGQVIYTKYSKQFHWNSFFYVSGQSRPFWAALKLL